MKANHNMWQNSAIDDIVVANIRISKNESKSQHSPKAHDCHLVVANIRISKNESKSQLDGNKTIKGLVVANIRISNPPYQAGRELT